MFIAPATNLNRSTTPSTVINSQINRLKKFMKQQINKLNKQIALTNLTT
ncbi:hypothetical protein A1F99_074560 [Pyrenophora tritici-repentis]|nr:hypothetical protein A1F99_074560 [Pyrenophora tritici-repentis]